MNSSCCALVLGLCSHGLAISRALRGHDIEVHAFESKTGAPGFKTNSAVVHRIQSINDDTLIQDLLDFRTTMHPDKKIVVFPTNDNNVKILAEHIDDIRDLFVVSWAASASTVRELLLKSNIEKRCVETGLSYPKSVIADDIASLPGLLSGLEGPFIVKPVKPQSGFKALKFHNARSLIDGLAGYANDFPIIVQEWITGTAEDLYFCALYLDRGTSLGSFVGRKLDSHPPALGQTTVAITHSDEQLLQMTQEFFAGLDISGPVSVEFKRDQNGRYWVIEPTVGRSDFWLGLCISAGFDLPLIEYRHCVGAMDTGLSIGPPANAIWFDSDRDPVAPIRYAFKWVSASADACRPVFSYFRTGDMLPFFHASYFTAIRIGASLLKRDNPGDSEPDSAGRERVVETFDSFDSLPQNFKDIMHRYAQICVFFDLSWFEIFNQTVARKMGAVKIYCLGDSEGNALAILPTIRHEERLHGVRLRKISSMANYYIPRFDIFTNELLCSRKSAFRSLLGHIRDSRDAWDVIDIFPMFRESVVDIRDVAHPSFPYYITENFKHAVDSDYASYICSRPSKHQNTIKRRYRKLERERQFYFDINTGRDETAEIMDNYHNVYRKSWKIDEPYPAFIDGLADWAAKNGSLRIGRLVIDDRVVASQIWIVANDTAHIYKLAYDRSYQAYSPGTLLTCAMFRYVIDVDKVSRLDFLLGSDAFKSDWMDLSTSVYGIQFTNTRSLKGLLLALFNTLSNLKRNWISRKAWYEAVH